MSSVRKERLTVTVDPDLVEAGNRAVATGQADSLSGWVNQAMASRAERDSKLLALANAVAHFESEFGEISAEEIERQGQADREHARIVRGKVLGAGSGQ